MNDSPHDFEKLQRLLKLKRQEMPPPGYFHQFSGQVLARVRAGETGEAPGFAERMAGIPGFFGRLLGLAENRTRLAGAFAAALCLLLMVGAYLGESSDTTATAPASSLTVAVGNSQSPQESLSPAAAPTLLAAAPDTGITLSTNPVLTLQPAASLFGQLNPPLQPASFGSPGR